MLAHPMSPTTENVPEESRHVIYCYVNVVDGKRYVGQTVCHVDDAPEDAIRRRWRAGYKKCSVFHRALCKHGEASFTSEVLEIVNGQEAANEAEPSWIARLGTLAPHGYNLDPGGGAAPRHPDTARKIREVLAKIPPELRSHTALARAAAKTPEERRASALKSWVTSAPDRRSRTADVLASTHTPESLSAAGRLGWAAVTSGLTAAQIHEMARARRATQLATTTAEELREIGCRAYAAKTPAQREHFHAANKAISPERRTAAAIKRESAQTPEQRRARALKAWATKRANASCTTSGLPGKKG